MDARPERKPVQRSSRARRSIIAGAVLAGSLCGAVAASSEASASVKRVQPGRFSVNWHEQLTRAELLEYAPRERSRPAVHAAHGWVFVADRFGKVRSLEPSGEKRWKIDAGGPIDAGLIVQGDTLYVATARGLILCLDAEAGEELWRYQTRAELGTTPTYHDGRLLVPSLADSLFALDVGDGELLWFHRRRRLDDLTIRGAARTVVEGSVAVTGFSDGAVIAFDVNDGNTLWSMQVGTGGFKDVDATPVIHEGVVYVVSYSGELLALDLETGRKIQRASVPEGAVRMESKGNKLFIAGPGFVSAHTAKNGGMVWRTGLDGGTPSDLLIHAGVLYLGTEEGPLVGLCASTGRPLAAFGTGNGVAAGPVRADSGVWAWSNGGWLYHLSLPSFD